jgi:hypothetical protein
VDSDEEKDGGNGAEDADGEPATELTKLLHVILRLLCLEKTVLGVASTVVELSTVKPDVEGSNPADEHKR